MKKYLKFFLVSLFSFLIVNENCFSYPSVEGLSLGEQLVWYAEEKNTEEVIRLLGKGVDIDFADSDGNTVLHFAVLNGDEEFVKALVLCGADLNTTDNDGHSPLFVALASENINMSHLLLDLDCDVTLKNKDGVTALHIAAILGDLSIVKKIVAKGAKIDAGSRWLNVTPLRSAALEGHCDISCFLLRNGADAWTTDECNISLLQDVFGSRSHSCVEKNIYKIRALLATFAILQAPKKAVSCFFK